VGRLGFLKKVSLSRVVLCSEWGPESKYSEALESGRMRFLDIFDTFSHVFLFLLFAFLLSLASDVLAGQLCTLSTPHGPQVGDLNIFSLHNPRERFWAARTRQLHASHVSVGDRLWSNLPYLRPLVTIVADSLKNYGVDEVGGRCHDLLGTR
jgi:hypothetical protein